MGDENSKSIKLKSVDTMIAQSANDSLDSSLLNRLGTLHPLAREVASSSYWTMSFNHPS